MSNGKVSYDEFSVAYDVRASSYILRVALFEIRPVSLQLLKNR
jgi:hypothetical protein